MCNLLAVMGPTGCGKTTLVKKIVASYGYVPVYEEWEQNPYLQKSELSPVDKYYNQKWFVENDVIRIRRAIEISQSHACVVDKLFIQNYAYLAVDNFDSNQKLVLKSILDSNLYLLKEIDTIICFNISSMEVLERIMIRNRDFEKEIPFAYIDALNHHIIHVADSLSERYHIKIIYYDSQNNYYEK